MRSAAFVVVATLPLAAEARADVVHLADGGRIEGEARRAGEEVVVRVDGGEMRLAAAAVQRIERTTSPLAELRERKEALPSGAIGPRMALGIWAREAGLEAEARSLFREVLRLEPNHAPAHEALGHVRVEGVWKTEAEAMTERGLVFHEGAWVKREEAEAEAEALAELVEERRRREAQAEAQAAAEAAREAAQAARAAAAAAEDAARGSAWGTPWLFGGFSLPGQTRLGPGGPAGVRLGLRTRPGAPGGQVVFGPLPPTGQAPAPPVPAPRSR